MVHEMSKYSCNNKKSQPNSTTKQHKLVRKLCLPVPMYTLHLSTVKRYLQAYERGGSIDLSTEF